MKKTFIIVFFLLLWTRFDYQKKDRPFEKKYFCAKVGGDNVNEGK